MSLSPFKHCIWIGLSLVLSGLALVDQWEPSAGSYAVSVFAEDWQDQKRNRNVPVKVYLPKGEGPFAVVIFSHGLGGSRDGYSYLGEFWASHGYASVHLQHLGSDDAVWKEQKNPMQAMRKAAADPRNAIQRALDVTFAIDELERAAANHEQLKGKLNLKRLGVAGHSFGAWTTLAVAGQSGTTPGGTAFSFRDERVKAAIPMSAPVSAKGDTKAAYESIPIPCLHLTGTHDKSIISTTKPEERRVPFDLSVNAPRYLLILDGGDHMVFSGPLGRSKGRASAKPMYALIKTATLAFWQAYLDDDAEAATYLQKDGFAERLGKAGTWEYLPAAN